MKICIVGSSKRFFSGMSAYTIVMANALAEQGHQVSAILLRNLVPLFLYPGRDRVGKGEYLLNFLPSINIYEGMDWNSPGTWLGACRFLQRYKLDAIIMHWWTSSVAHMQLLLAISRYMNGKKPSLILEMHEVVDPLEEKILPIRLYSRVAGKTLIKLCDAYTAHSNEARQAIMETYNILPNKIHVVSLGPYDIYGTSDREKARKELKLDGFTILYFGIIRQYKGVPLLVKAFNMLPEDILTKSQLVIAGEDWGDDPSLRPALANSLYKHRIIFRPEFVPDELVSKYFSASDVIVLPYLRTCGSAVVSIAVAQGKPIITTDLATMRECLVNYKGASFFPVGDVCALRELLVENYEQWQSGNIQHYHFSGPSWNIIAQKYEQIISGLSNEKQ